MNDSIRIREATAPGVSTGGADGVEVDVPADVVGDGPGSNVGTVAGGLGPVAEGVLRMAAAGVAVGWPVTPVAAGRRANQSP